MSGGFCECDHTKSQHNQAGNVCDYAGYSCECTQYKRATPPQPSTEQRVNQILIEWHRARRRIRAIDVDGLRAFVQRFSRKS